MRFRRIQKIDSSQDPVPLRVIVCGPVMSPSVITIVPVRFPLAVGVNFTSRLQEDFGPSDVPQLLFTEKSPLATMVAMTNPAEAGFVIVMICGGLVVPTACTRKVKVSDENVSASPVPTRDMVCGLAGSLWVIVTPP